MAAVLGQTATGGSTAELVGAPRQGSLDEQLVEIHGVGCEVEALDRELGPLGAPVDPNGKRGVAHWDGRAGLYAVTTQEGFVLRASEENLRVCEHTDSQAGNCDLVWPSISAGLAGPGFALAVAEALQSRGYCFIQMPEVDPSVQTSIVEAASARGDYCLPPLELEEAYLGSNHGSKVAWLAAGEDDSAELGPFTQNLSGLSHWLVQTVGDFLCFEPWHRCFGTMLRMPLAGPEEQQALSPGPLAQTGASVEQHLDFLQRRRLCFKYLLDCEGGSIELYQRGTHPKAHVAALCAKRDRLLVFRHDVLEYCYKPGAKRDLVLQTWLMEAPQLLRLDGFEGSQRGLEVICGGPAQAPDRQVHVTSAACRFPAAAYGLERAEAMFLMQADGFVYIPLSRWDMSQYYSAESESGKSKTKHSALLNDEELICFDNAFFGIPAADAVMLACAQRHLLELSYEALAAVGYTLPTLKGTNLSIAIGDQGLDEDAWRGFDSDKHAWLRCCTPHKVNSAAVLAHMLGTSGPAIVVDTACSSSLVSANVCHAQLRQHRQRGTETAVSMGVMQIASPFAYVGLSAAGMLGSGGRCKTFDNSANGYNRGEGTGGLVLQAGSDLQLTLDRLACLVSSYTNQDGRSASLTAPNGSSQQLCVRSSLRQAELFPEDLVSTENHGTGTALGDPIEAGSIRAVFRNRQEPLQVTSGKSLIGHLEATAGSVGLLKLICTLTRAGIPSNCHLRQLNGHIEAGDFPGLFPVEVCRLPREYHYAGANSFGFGGTNSRAELWARCFHSQRWVPRDAPGSKLRMDLLGSSSHMQTRLDRLDMISTSCARCLGPMCWLCGAAAPDAGGRGKHRCTAIRSEGAAYGHCSDCYAGTYLCEGSPPEAPAEDLASGERLFLVGTWNAWGRPTEMCRVAGDLAADTYEADVRLGDTRQELFHLAVARPGSTGAVLHPIVKRASRRVRVAGPSKDAQGQHWLIDGFHDGAHAGTAYRVRFKWGDGIKRIDWEPVGLSGSPGFQHTYCLASSLTGWAPLSGWNAALHPPEDSTNMCDVDDPALWWWQRGRIPASGKVELMFVRDHDQAQMIYPLQEHPTETSVPVMGPDEGGSGKRWLAWGRAGEALFTSIRVVDGGITVKISTATMGSRVWRSMPNRAGQAYHLAGPSSDSDLIEMKAAAAAPGAYACRLTVGPAGCEEFRILVNGNRDMAMYPASNGDAPGVGLLCGPDRKGRQRNWRVEGFPGQELEVVLDFGAEDQHCMVTCRPC